MSPAPPRPLPRARNPGRLAWAPFALVLLGACTVETLHVPERTAGEQAVLARALERAVNGLDLEGVGNGRVQVEVASLTPDCAAYVRSLLQLRILERGLTVSEDPGRTAPDCVLHVMTREGGAETRTRIVQLSLPIPVPQAASQPIGLTLSHKQVERGIVWLRAYVVDAASGKLLAEVQSSGAEATTVEVRVFGVIGPVRTVNPATEPEKRESVGREEN